MTATGSTVPRRRLGRELRLLREACKIKSEDVADEFDWSRSKMWRIETGQVPVTKVDLMALADLYEASDEVREVLTALSAESKSKGWWQGTDTLPDWFQMYLGMESAATHLRHYDGELVPGLLQTEDYCRAIYRVSSTIGTDAINAQVALRMQRQTLLTRDEPAAPRFHVILNESVIRRPVGGHTIMAAQLTRLIEVTDLPNVDVRVLPFAVGEHAGMMGTFVILSFAEEREPDVAYLESPTGSLYLEKPKEITRYNFVMRDLEDRALDSIQSRAFIASALKEM